MLKLICNHVGSSKKFFHTVLSDDDPQQETPQLLLLLPRLRRTKKPSQREEANKDLPQDPCGQSRVCFHFVFVSVSEEMNVFQSPRVNTLVTGVEIFE